MRFLAGVIGSGAGVIVIAAVVIILAKMDKAPAVTHGIIRRLLIVLAYGAGGLIAFTGLGALWARVAGHVAGMFGGMHAGAPHTVLVIASLVMILGLVIAVIWEPDARTALVAAFAPALLMLTSYGFIHQFWLATGAPAQQLAASFAAWLGG